MNHNLLHKLKKRMNWLFYINKICSINILINFIFLPFTACECVVFQSYGRSHGSFQSPNFPSIYPTNVNCILYTFIGDLDEIVELSFYEFDLQVPTTSKWVKFCFIVVSVCCVCSQLMFHMVRYTYLNSYKCVDQICNQIKHVMISLP